MSTPGPWAFRCLVCLAAVCDASEEESMAAVMADIQCRRIVDLRFHMLIEQHFRDTADIEKTVIMEFKFNRFYIS